MINGRKEAGVTIAHWPKKDDLAKCEKCEFKTGDVGMVIEVKYYEDEVDLKGRGVVEHEQFHVDSYSDGWYTVVWDVDPSDGKKFETNEECNKFLKDILGKYTKFKDKIQAIQDEEDAESY